MATHLSKITILQLFVIISIGLTACRGLLAHSFVPTHDAEYHIIRVWQFDTMMRAGFLFPRWAPDLDNGYGVPVLMFFYPLPNYVASIFTLLGSTYVESVFLTLASALVVSGIGFYLWMREHVSGWPACIAAVSYMLVPYHLVDVLVRGSVGEAWSLAVLPFVLWCVIRLVRSSPGSLMRSTGIVSFGVALLLLSHNVVGMMGFAFSWLYGISLVVFPRGFVQGTGKYLTAGFVMGVFLTAIYYIPVIVESPYITGLQINTAADHFPSLFQLIFPSWGSGFSVPGIADGMSFQVGLVHIAAFLIVCVAGIIKRDRACMFMAFVTLASWYIMLPFSSWLWDMVPALNYMQFPWRLLSIVIVSTSCCIGFVIEYKPMVMVPVVFVSVLLLYGGYTNVVRYEYREDAYYLSNPVWASGTATLGNTFGTVWSTYHKQHILTPRVKKGTATITTVQKGPVLYDVTSESDNPASIQFPVNYYPGWTVSVNGIITPSYQHEGLLTFDVPSGKHSIMIWFGQTPVRITATLLSMIAAVTALMMIMMKQTL